MNSGQPSPSPNDVAVKTRVLVVDDNQDSATTMSMLLRVLGAETRTAYDGEQAVAVAAEFRPAMIFLDIGLPKLDGYEAARRIRSEPWGKSIVLAALTGWGNDDDVARSRDAGFDHHLIKPLELDALRQLLNELPPAQAV